MVTVHVYFFSDFKSTTVIKNLVSIGSQIRLCDSLYLRHFRGVTGDLLISRFLAMIGRFQHLLSKASPIPFHFWPPVCCCEGLEYTLHTKNTLMPKVFRRVAVRAVRTFQITHIRRTNLYNNSPLFQWLMVECRAEAVPHEVS